MAVRKRPDRDSWMVDVVVDGTRVRESFKTKREALAREKELIAQEVTGTLPSVADAAMSFRRFAPEYLEWCELNKAPNTFRVERYLINAKMLPFFGDAEMRRIAPRDIERYKLKRKRDGVGVRAINLDLAILSVMFKLAIQNGYAHENPVAKVPKFKEPKKPPRFLSEDEIRRLLDAAQDTYLYPLIVCGLHTGLRKQELFNLKWRHVDFERGTITVQPDDDRNTKDYDFRVIEMTATLRRELTRLYENRLHDEFVFTYGGNPLSSNVARTWRRIMRTAGIENCSLHTLRHTFASHLAMAGVPLAHIQQLMGHDDYDTTLAYAHLSAESHKGQVHRLPFAGSEKES